MTPQEVNVVANISTEGHYKRLILPHWWTGLRSLVIVHGFVERWGDGNFSSLRFCELNGSSPMLGGTTLK